MVRGFMMVYDLFQILYEGSFVMCTSSTLSLMNTTYRVLAQDHGFAAVDNRLSREINVLRRWSEPRKLVSLFDCRDEL